MRLIPRMHASLKEQQSTVLVRSISISVTFTVVIGEHATGSTSSGDNESSALETILVIDGKWPAII